jgi:hypothetical protein
MAIKLPIIYNRNLKLGAVSEDPVNFLLHTKLFDDFLIVTPQSQEWLNKLDIKINNIHLKPLKSGTEFKDFKSFVKSKRFADFVKEEGRRKYVLYSPLAPPYKINPLVYLMNSPTIAHAFENKRYFRDEFADLIRMPEYVIRHLNELDKAAAYKDLQEELGVFVLQDEESFGSKGTFIIRNQDDYVSAVKSLKRFSQGRSIVVSKFVEGETCSIQVCITKYGVFSGGIQKQLVASPFLCNPSSDGGTKWLGGELGAQYSEFIQHQAREIASVIGSELASHGYKGIFGIDLIITPEDNVYAIEINARHTGYSFLISDMQLKEKKIPFLLLHLLEMGNYDYEVTDLDALPSTGTYKRPVSYMIVTNKKDESIFLSRDIEPGIYTYTNGALKFSRPANSLTQLNTKNEILILSRFGKGSEVGSYKRILKIIKLGGSMKGKDLNKESQKLVEAVMKYFELPR